jgi:diacylglycerol kinase family enzyme
MAGYLLVNPRSGDDEPTADELVRAARLRGIRCHVLRDGDDAAELARAADADVLGAAGGDGSLAPVASAAVERRLPFVCVPFGTRNHFARDVGLDRDDPIGSLDAFAGVERLVDVGRVGDRIFLNNVSIGLYADLVHRREHHRRRREALAQARAVWRLLGARKRLGFRIDGEKLHAGVVLVGNNCYELSPLTIGTRAALDEGVLHLYAVDGWLPSRWDERVAGRFELELPEPSVRAAIDGEPLVLESSDRLVFECLPRSLRVLLPRARYSDSA